MGITGAIMFILIFVLIPLYYAIDHLRNPKFATVPDVEHQYMKCESPIERRLYTALTSRGYDVRTQVPCGRYRIDLALPQHRLAIECDGKAYHSSPEQKAHDRRKNAYLRKSGWRVLRFTGSQINSRIPKVIREIEKNI